ncbi:Uncharacterised protein [Mycobacteroides abscessus subsp. abscessus]|uniref:Transmembrane protein n=1 Tax=Mycobacteroides immunogenum TaxID=83262 RepID=A0A7V8LKJ8_9MYCO|nr:MULTISPECIES: hypothetical protein [Mycobacteroides]AMT70560.1 hypothetical protein ABG82_09795 [Mycobacteroides immunogenum]ANO03646.1 hypothetical protein BAB75_09850 [Mycobacteroides immunogenum]KIU38486.1 hypothetical protein TL11_21815 [Mycobacteroides immunogenum]KPG04305.1 hypothetical protein AN909_23930 [Mycobacteroides immunogenum]KPG04778.1 hypothetical protein AN908_23285 [Mycobacteroides immunogenum]
MEREVEVPFEVARALDKRYDKHADRYGPIGFVGLVAGIIGTGVALSNHPAPAWAAVVAVVGWLVCVGSFVFAIGASRRDTLRVMDHFDRDVQDYDDWADDDDEDLEDDQLPEEDEYPRAVEPPQATITPAPPAAGNLLSSLRQQNQ